MRLVLDAPVTVLYSRIFLRAMLLNRLLNDTGKVMRAAFSTVSK